MVRPRAGPALAAAAIAAVASLSAGCGEAAPSTIHVAGRGDCADEHAARVIFPARPFCSIQEAVEIAPAGAVVAVAPGRYGRLTLRGIERQSPITIRSARARGAVIDGIDIEDSSGLRIEGFKIRNTVGIERVRDIALVSNDISPNDVTVGAAEDLAFEGNAFHDLTIAGPARGGRCVPRRCGYGLRLARVRGAAIRRNTFTDIPADGIQMLEVSDIAIVGNRFERIAPTIDPSVHSDAVQAVGDSQGIRIEANRFLRVRGPILGDGTHRGLVVVNNLFDRPRDWALNAVDTPGMRLLSNTTWESGKGVIFGRSTRGVIAVNNVLDRLRARPRQFASKHHNLIVAGPRSARDIAGPPVFGAPLRGNFVLRQDTPGAAAGTSRGAPERDLRGTPRGSPPDMGAYERP